MNNSLPPHGLCGHPSSLSALHEYAKKGRAGAKRPLAGPAPSAPGGAGVPGPLAFRLPAARLCRRVSRPSEGSPRAPGPEGPPRSSRRREGRRGAGLDEDPNGLQLGAPGLRSGYVEDSLPAEVRRRRREASRAGGAGVRARGTFGLTRAVAGARGSQRRQRRARGRVGRGGRSLESPSQRGGAAERSRGRRGHSLRAWPLLPCMSPALYYLNTSL